jgi:hypothetical protein
MAITFAHAEGVKMNGIPLFNKNPAPEFSFPTSKNDEPT